LALMVHELETNAVKYGALSVPDGYLRIDWSVDNGKLQLRWAERGGPAITAQAARGFGTTLIEESAKSENGLAQMHCEPEGIRWDISMALPQEAEEQAAFRLFQAKPAARTEQEKGHSAMRSATPRAPLQGLRFLVVDDEPLIALDFATSLQEAGAQAEVATAERQALQLIASASFDGVLLDANLHGRPSEEVAAALAGRQIPFVFITGYGSAGLQTSFKDARVLAKPLSGQRLIAAAAELVLERNLEIQLHS